MFKSSAVNAVSVAVGAELAVQHAARPAQLRVYGLNIQKKTRMIQIETRQVRDVLLIEMSGRLDSPSAGEAEDRLLNIVEGKDGPVLLKLERLEYVTSVGLRVIVRLAKLLQESGGELMICNAKGVVKDAFEIFSFRDLTKIYDTEKEAFAAIR